MAVACKHGHERTEANTYVLRGCLYCRVCGAERNRRRYHAKGLKDRRNKPRDREVWRNSYRRDPQKHRDRNAVERRNISDNYALTLIADQHIELRDPARANQQLLNVFKAQLQLKRLIHERSK